MQGSTTTRASNVIKLHEPQKASQKRENEDCCWAIILEKTCTMSFGNSKWKSFCGDIEWNNNFDESKYMYVIEAKIEAVSI